MTDIAGDARHRHRSNRTSFGAGTRRGRPDGWSLNFAYNGPARVFAEVDSGRVDTTDGGEGRGRWCPSSCPGSGKDHDDAADTCGRHER